MEKAQDDCNAWKELLPGQLRLIPTISIDGFWLIIWLQILRFLSKGSIAFNQVGSLRSRDNIDTQKTATANGCRDEDLIPLALTMLFIRS